MQLAHLTTFMIEDSKDILYIISAFAVLWVAIFLSWFLYYLGQTMRHINKIVEEAEEKTKAVFSAIDFIRDKIGLLASVAGVVVQSLFKNSDEKDVKKQSFKSKKK